MKKICELWRETCNLVVLENSYDMEKLGRKQCFVDFGGQDMPRSEPQGCSQGVGQRTILPKGYIQQGLLTNQYAL